MRKMLPFNIALTCLLFAACVTINVYFPAAAAEKAADQIIDQVTGGSGAAAPRTPPQTRLERDEPGAARQIAARIIDVLFPAAHAQPAPNLDIASPEIRAITGSMAQRFGQLEKYFDAGAVGLTANGLVEIRDQNAIALAERATVKRLVTEDNRDRDALYTEIAKANGHPEWADDIRQTFARRWIERGAKTGWYYQDASGAWKQK